MAAGTVATGLQTMIVGRNRMPDTTAPVLTGLTFPRNVNVTHDRQPFEWVLTGSDEGGSGIHYALVSVVRPAGYTYNAYINGGVDGWTDGTGTSAETVYESDDPGTYLISGVTIVDLDGNSRSYTAAQLVQLGIATSYAVIADTVAPQLTGLTLPTTIDVTSGRADVTFGSTASDAGSGISSLRLSFTRPDGGYGGAATFYSFVDDWSDGSSLTQTSYYMTDDPGIYTLSSAEVTDEAGNVRTYTTAQLAAAGMRTTFTIVADTDAPRLTGLTLPDNVDVHAGNQEARFAAEGADTGGSGISQVRILVAPPAGSTQGYTYINLYDFVDDWSDGSSATDYTIYTTFAPGTYTVESLEIQDFAGNITTYTKAQLRDDLHLSTSFTVTSDGVAPRLTALSLPANVDPSLGDQDFTISAGAADTGGSGVRQVTLTFDGPLFGSPNVTFYGFSDSWADGLSAQDMRVSASTAPGTYTVTNATVTDLAGNQRSYTTQQLSDLGIRTTVTVAPGAPDTAAPLVTALGAPVALDLVGGNRQLALSAIATDASGVASVALYLDRDILLPAGPAGGFLLNGAGSDSWANGSTAGTSTLAANAASGAYELFEIVTIDNAGNSQTQTADQLWAARGVSFGFFLLNASIAVTLPNVLRGTGGADALTGTAANNVLYTLGGADTLSGQGGSDWLYGGSGDDTYLVDGATDLVFESLAQGSDRVLTTASYRLRPGSEVEQLAAFNTASLTPLRLTGNEFVNELVGGAGADTLDGGLKADAMTGNGGNDTYLVDNAGDRVIEVPGGGTDKVLASVSYTLSFGTAVEVLRAADATALTPLALGGNAGANTIVGNAGANRIDGGEGADRLEGLGGDDTYLVDLATDVVVELTGQGFDSIFTTASYVLAAGVSVEVLSAAVFAGTTAINLTGNEFANRITGNAAANRLDGGAGADTLAGGAGSDTYVVDNPGDRVDEANVAGTDLVLSSVSFSLAGGFAENLTLTGLADIDGTGNGLANRLVGNSGRNRLDGGTGADRMEGRAGDDTYVVDNVLDVVTEVANAGIDLVESAIAYTLVGREIEHLTLTGGLAINGTGNAYANRIIGNGASNHIDGGDGADTLDGGAGADTMRGGAGDDTFTVDNAGDRVIEASGAGTDLVLSSLSFNLSGQHIENLTLTGTAAISGTGNSLANRILGNSAANVIDGGTGADTLAGGAGNDTYTVDNAGDRVIEASSAGTDLVLSSVSFNLSGQHIENLTLTGVAAINGTGNSLANRILGNSVANAIDGGTGADTMWGGAGDDTFTVDNTGDRVIEASGAGTDLVLSSVSFSLSGQHIENLTLTGAAAINGTGNSLANRILGNSAANVINGGTGADTMAGGSGNDTYTVDNTGDRVIEASGGGTDLVLSSVGFNLSSQYIENLTLTGAAAINGTGNTLDNRILGNSAANVINGGTGADTMAGGAGNDTFIFNTQLGVGNIDQITDFDVVGDSIRLDDAVFLGLATGTLAASAFAKNLTGQAATASGRIIYETDTGRLFYDSDGMGGAAGVHFATLTAGLALTNADFLVF
jgi:Ca2+-binding RTX toxin-like protein